MRDRGRMLLVGVLALSLLGNALALGGAWRLHQIRQAVLESAGGEARLPRALRRQIGAALAAHRADFSADLAALGQARADFVAAATAQPPDRAAAAAALAAFRAAADRLMAQAQPVMLQALE